MNKRFFAISGLLAALVLSIPFITRAAEAKSGPTGPMVATIDPGAVTTGAVITTDTMDTTYFRSVICEMQNDAGAARSFVVTARNDAGAVMSTKATIPVATAASATLVWDPDAGTTVVPATGVTLINTPLDRKVKVEAAAAASIGRITCNFKSR